MKFKTIFFISLFTANLIFGQQITLNDSEDALEFSLDYAQFRYDQKRVYVEIYYSFYQDQLKYLSQDSLEVATFNIDAKIYHGDSLWYSHNWNSRSILSPAVTGKKIQELFTLTGFILPPGQYRYVTAIKDLNSEAWGEQSLLLDLSLFPEESLTLSDIELSSYIVQDTSRGLFNKNSYRVIPNPNAIYGLEKPMLYFYAEIYNLSKGPDSTYTVQYAILDNNGTEIRAFPPRVRKKGGTSLVEVGGVNVISFPTGKYFFELRVKDGTGPQVARKKKFFIYRKGEVIKPASVSTTTLSPLSEYYKSLDEKALDEEFYSASYLATKEEREIFKTLDLEAKRDFLVKFWNARDPQPETVRNELRDKHLERLHYANQHFGGFREGWKTDRGRILLKYGKPDEVEKTPSTGEGRGFEIWRYLHIEGGLIFVFVDKGGYGDLELVHSNARGEIYDPDWRRWVEIR